MLRGRACEKQLMNSCCNASYITSAGSNAAFYTCTNAEKIENRSFKYQHTNSTSATYTCCNASYISSAGSNAAFYTCSNAEKIEIRSFKYQHTNSTSTGSYTCSK